MECDKTFVSGWLCEFPNFFIIVSVSTYISVCLSLFLSIVFSLCPKNVQKTRKSEYPETSYRNAGPYNILIYHCQIICKKVLSTQHLQMKPDSA